MKSFDKTEEGIHTMKKRLFSICLKKVAVIALTIALITAVFSDIGVAAMETEAVSGELKTMEIGDYTVSAVGQDNGDGTITVTVYAKGNLYTYDFGVTYDENVEVIGLTVPDEFKMACSPVTTQGNISDKMYVAFAGASNHPAALSYDGPIGIVKFRVVEGTTPVLGLITRIAFDEPVVVDPEIQIEPAPPEDTPELSEEPDSTDVPESSEEPDSTDMPESSEEPNSTDSPESSEEPDITDTPNTSDAPEPTPSPSGFEVNDFDGLYGNMDDNTIIDANDALLVLKIAAKLVEPTAEQMIAGDVDNSGKVDAADALLVLKKAAKLIEKFPIEE